MKGEKSRQTDSVDTSYLKHHPPSRKKAEDKQLVIMPLLPCQHGAAVVLDKTFRTTGPSFFFYQEQHRLRVATRGGGGGGGLS